MKQVKLRLDACEGVGSQVDNIEDAFVACGIDVQPDPECEGSDTFGWILTVDKTTPTNEQGGKPVQEFAEAQAPMTEAEIMKPVNFKDGCFGMRADIELVKLKVKNWLSHPELMAEPIEKEPMNKHQEMAANLTLAYRHLEDARMRIGKAVQAYDGGQSCYPQ